MLRSVDELRVLAEKVDRKKIAVVFAHDDHVISAIKDASDLGIIEPILIGEKLKIEELIKEFKLLPPYSIIDEPDGEIATKIAMDLVNDQQVDLLMKGLIDTKILLKGVVNNDYGIKDAKLLSHVGIVSFPTYHKVLFASDGAMNITPNFEQKILIIENSVKLAKSLGYKMPKVGLVSAVEKVNPKIQSTVEAKEIVDYYQDKEIDFLIDGPFAIDNLVSMDSVKQKNITSPVGGDCDILIFPNLDAGNIFYKTSVFLANGKSAGVILGAKVPIVLTSRADSAEAKLNSILLAVLNHDGLSNLSN
ncbi:MAG: phosphate acyltransferase [Candidatus Izemoplasmatales bacterium]|nr:phosphate acyltransferase [Candidatus Izemoplasmatales bacterium]